MPSTAAGSSPGAAPITAQAADDLDRTGLPIQEPKLNPIATLDARWIQQPARDMAIVMAAYGQAVHGKSEERKEMALIALAHRGALHALPLRRPGEQGERASERGVSHTL